MFVIPNQVRAGLSRLQILPSPENPLIAKHRTFANLAVLSATCLEMFHPSRPPPPLFKPGPPGRRLRRARQVHRPPPPAFPGLG